MLISQLTQLENESLQTINELLEEFSGELNIFHLIFQADPIPTEKWSQWRLGGDNKQAIDRLELFIF